MTLDELIGEPGYGFPYLYRFDRMGRKGQRCACLARGALNSCLVAFPDGYRAVTSRNALKRADPNKTTSGEA